MAPPDDSQLPDGVVCPVVDSLRRNASAIAALQAEQLRMVARLESEVRAKFAATDLGPRAPFDPDDETVVQGLARDEVVATLGVSPYAADRLVTVASRTVSAMPAALDALAAGLLDADRLHAVVEGVAHVDDDTAAHVTGRLLGTLDKAGCRAPWEGPSSAAWRKRITTAVQRADREAAHRRREAAIAARRVRAWANGDGTGTLQFLLKDTDARDVHDTLRDLADQRAELGPDGKRLTLDQRMADAAVDLFARVAAGDDLPVTTRRRERDIGLVLHADTLFDDGPAAEEPGELRGLGGAAVVDATSARKIAQEQCRAGRALSVLLVGADGLLQRLVRLTSMPAGGWTRTALEDAVRAALPKLPPLGVETYAPSRAIIDHVRAARPRCSAPGCRRTARWCDLDHDSEWPRGPTHVRNMDPKCRRHHGYKTHGLWHSRLEDDGSVTWTTLLGTTVVTRHEPLPGCG